MCFVIIMHIPDIVNYFLHHAHRHLGPGFFLVSILSIKCASTTYMNPFDMLRCEIQCMYGHSSLLVCNSWTVWPHFLPGYLLINKSALDKFYLPLKIYLDTCTCISHILCFVYYLFDFKYSHHWATFVNRPACTQ
jgi:hypothetical protein